MADIDELKEAVSAWTAFVRAREAMNAAIPDVSTATPAERTLYDERYRADHEAERTFRSEALRLFHDGVIANLLAAIGATRPTDEAIQPCPTPWCGGEGEVRSYGGFQVVCQGTDAKTGCGVEGPECATPEEAIAAWNARPTDEAIQPDLVEAAKAVIERMSSTYRARNGREMGIQGDDGEKCWIVHSDDIETLRAAIAATRPVEREVRRG